MIANLVELLLIGLVAYVGGSIVGYTLGILFNWLGEPWEG